MFNERVKTIGKKKSKLTVRPILCGRIDVADHNYKKAGFKNYLAYNIQYL